MDFSKIVKKNLKKNKKNQVWLAAKLGITPQSVNRLFKNPTLETIRRIDAFVPLPEAAALLHSGKRLSSYVGNDGQASPEILSQLEALTLEYSDVLEDPDARADFAGLVQVIVELSPQQRKNLLQFVKGFDKAEKLQD